MKKFALLVAVSLAVLVVLATVANAAPDGYDATQVRIDRAADAKAVQAATADTREIARKAIEDANAAAKAAGAAATAAKALADKPAAEHGCNPWLWAIAIAALILALIACLRRGRRGQRGPEGPQGPIGLAGQDYRGEAGTFDAPTSPDAVSTPAPLPAPHKPVKGECKCTCSAGPKGQDGRDGKDAQDAVCVDEVARKAANEALRLARSAANMAAANRLRIKSIGQTLSTLFAAVQTALRWAHIAQLSANSVGSALERANTKVETVDRKADAAGYAARHLMRTTRMSYNGPEDRKVREYLKIFGDESNWDEFR